MREVGVEMWGKRSRDVEVGMREVVVGRWG